MSDGRAKDAGELFGDTMTVLRAHFGLAATAWLIMTTVGIVSDLLGPRGQSLTIASLIASIAFQYEITLVALSHLGLAERGRRRFWALLGLNLLSGLGILLGLVLLILPGLYLYVRWSVAVPVLIAEEAGIGEAFTRSGEEISGRFWPVAGLFLLIYSSWLVAFFAVLAAPVQMALLSTVAVNMALNMALVGGWCAAVAVYAADKGGDRLAQVFA